MNVKRFDWFMRTLRNRGEVIHSCILLPCEKGDFIFDSPTGFEFHESLELIPNSWGTYIKYPDEINELPLD